MSYLTDNALRSELLSKTERTIEEINFGVNDKKGRAIGSRVQFWVEVSGPVSENTDKQVNRRLPGTHYVMLTNALRDGKWFGAYTGERSFSSPEARDSAKAKYLKDAAKRATKEANKGVAA